jgi:hypothetical protein
MQSPCSCGVKTAAKSFTHLATVERQRKARARHCGAGGRRPAVDAEHGVDRRHHRREPRVHDCLIWRPCSSGARREAEHVCQIRFHLVKPCRHERSVHAEPGVAAHLTVCSAGAARVLTLTLCFARPPDRVRATLQASELCSPRTKAASNMWGDPAARHRSAATSGSKCDRYLHARGGVSSAAGDLGVAAVLRLD